MDILTVLVLLICEHGILSIYLCLLQFPLFMYCTFQSTDLPPPWLNLFLSILFFLMQLVNGIVFLISLSGSSLLVNTNTTDFCLMTLYPAAFTEFVH